MADGNLGSLWMSLGIKETVSDGLKKVLSSLDKTDEKSAAVGKEIKSFIKELNSAKVSDSLLKSIGRIGELLSVSTSGAESLGRVLKGLNVKEMSALGGNVNMSNLKEAHSLITKIMQAMSSRNMSNASMDKFFDLGNAQGFLTQIMTIDKNLKSLKDSSKGITDTVLKGDAKALVDKLTSLRRQFLDSFNSGAWRGNNAIQEQLNNATNSLIQFYDKLNASKGNQSLFDSIPKETAKANEALKATEEQAKKTAEAVASIGTKRKPVVENQEFAKDIERLTKNPASLKEGSNDIAGVKKQADDARESVIKLRYDLNEVLNAFRGSASKNLGVGEAGEKGRKLVDILNQINKKREELSRKEGGAEASKEMGAMVNNAMAYLRLLQRIDIAERGLQDNKSANPNVDASKFKEASREISHFRDQLVKLESAAFLTGVDGANVLKNYASAWQMTLGDVDKIIGKFQKRNPLSDLDSNFSKIDSKIDSFREKLARLRDLMSEGTNKGFNTSMLTDRITGMSGIVSQMEKAMNNEGKMLSNADRMKQLFSDMQVEMSKTTAAFQAYDREKGKVIAQEKEHEIAVKSLQKEWKDLTTSGFRGGRFVTPGSKEAAQGYLDIANAYKKAVDALQTKHGEAKINLTRLLDEYNKEVKDLESKIKAISPKMDGLAWNGKKLSPKDLAAYEDLVKQLEHLNNTKVADFILAQTNFDIEERKLQRLIGLIKDYEQLSERVAKGTYKPYDANSYEQKRISDTAALKNAIIERYNVEQEAKNKKKKDDADAERQSKANEKQRQTELENSLRRIQSMEKALANLQEKRFTSKMFGLDVSEADAKIFAMKIRLNELYDIANRLGAKDMTAVGKLGNLGNGREIKAANDLARSYDKANKEAQRGVEIEQKRQQEIAKSAAKARNDLASAFAGANAEAKKMQSIVGDIKSLFLQGGIVFGAQQFFNSIVQTGGEIVQQHIALQSILGDAAKANELFEQTKQLALQSPFKFGELNRDVKQLAAFGVEANDLYDTTKRLADIASGLGVSFERLGLAYGQVKSRSWLDGKELRQFAYAGLPLLQRITEMYNATGKNGKSNYSEADVKEMISKRQVSFDDVQKVLWKMTDEGGQFYNMQFVLSDTLLGRWNKLIDAWDIMLGKFAEGKNIVGGTFAFMINRATDLVLMLDKLTPTLMALGAAFVAKKLSGSLNGNALANKYKSAVAQQMRAYAIEQQELIIEGKISQEKAKQNILDREELLTSQKTMTASYSKLALEGKMSVLQMQRAAKEGLIEEELVKQLATMGMITQRQAQIILNGGKMAAVMNMAGSKIKGIFSALGGWWGIGLAALAEGISFIANEWNAVEDKANELRESQSGKIDSYNEMLGKETPESNAEMQKRVDEMKKLLADSGAYTKTLQEQVEKAKSLREQYELLRKGIDTAKDNSYADADIVASAILNSGGWRTGLPGSDNIQENVKQLHDSMSDYKSVLSTFDSVSRDVMNRVANSILGPKYAAETLEDKLLTIQRNKSMDVFYARVRNSGVRINGSLYSISDAAREVMSDIKDISDTNVPYVIYEIQKKIGKFGDDFKRFCQDQPDRFRSMLLAMADDATWLVPEINKKLEELTGYKFTAGKDPKDTKLSSIQRQIYGRLGGDDKAYNLLKPYIDDNSLYKTNNNLQEVLRDLYNEKKAQEKIGSKNSAAAKSYDELWTATFRGTGYKYIPEDKKSNKVPKTRERKEDTALKNWQERLSSYKSARQTYQNYKKLPGWDEEKAKKYVESLYTNIAGLDLNNYEAAMNTLQKSLTFNTPERKKALTQLIRERADWRYSEVLKPESEDKANDNNEEMEALVKRLDLQKELVEKTGDKNFGDMVWGYNIMVDDKVETMMNQYYAKYGKLFGASDALTTTESQAKKKYTGAGEFDAWKQITTLLKDNYYNALKKSADVIKEHLSDEEKIASTRAKYNELIKDAEKVGNKRAVTAYRQDLRKEVAKLSLGKYKKTEEYMNFFGSIVSLGKTEAKKYAKNIENELNKAMRDGAISAKEYSDEVAKLGEQLKKLDEVQPSFLHGGLGGMAQSMMNQGKEKVQAGNAKYTKAKEMYDLFQEFGDGHGMTTEQMKMNAGESMMQGGQQLMQGAGEMEGTIAMIDTIIHGINDLVQGLNDTFQDIKETAEALGANTSTDGWTDADSFFSGFASASASATKGWDSLKNGDIGGVISGVVGSFTGWIKSFSAGHDKKLDRQIELAERELKELQNLSSNIKQSVEDSLGGIYNYQRSTETMNKLGSIKQDYERRQRAKNDPDPFKRRKYAEELYTSDTYDAVNDAMGTPSYYHDQLALLQAQKDEVQRQQRAEEGKKKSDDSKIQDYKQQETELEQSIRTFSQNFLKDVYSIDLKSWASELTDTVVSAWENGEDAVDAYRKKVKDMVKDVTKNIVSQKIMQMALQKPLSFLEDTLKEKGQLDETDMTNFAKSLIEAGDTSVSQITQIFESLKQMGYDMSDNGNSSSTTNSVKGITEETADILASYVNAIRLDVSVNRENVKQIADAMKSLPEMGAIAQSQLTAMNQLVTLAEYRNSKLDDMYAWMRSVTSGSGTRSIKVN